MHRDGSAYRNFQSSLVWDFVYIGSLSLRVDYIYQ